MRLPRARASAAAATLLTAVAGGLATDPDSAWFHRLRKPGWYPPPATFGIVWTGLYAAMAWAGGEVLARSDSTRSGSARPGNARSGDARSGFAVAGAVNLALNAAWPPLFFRAHRPWLAAAECAVLTGSTADLVRRAARVSPPAAAALVPYAAWTAFATALSAAIARRNG